MKSTLFELPLPSSSAHVAFAVQPKRSCVLTCDWDDLPEPVILAFSGVEAYMCFYDRACSIEQIQESYDKLVEINDSKWLQEIRQRLVRNGVDPSDLRHMMISFDDGPCYEFLARGFRISSAGLPLKGVEL